MKERGFIGDGRGLGGQGIWRHDTLQLLIHVRIMLTWTQYLYLCLLGDRLYLKRFIGTAKGYVINYWSGINEHAVVVGHKGLPGLQSLS